MLATQSWPVLSLIELLAEFSLVSPCMLCLLCSHILARQTYKYKYNAIIRPLVNKYFGSLSGIIYRKLGIKAAVALVVLHPFYLEA